MARAPGRAPLRSIENIFKKHVRLAEIKRHVTPHSLRHTMAARLVSSGADIRDVQEILGHASILFTQVYTRLPIQKRTRTPQSHITRIVAETAGARLAIKK